MFVQWEGDADEANPKGATNLEATTRIFSRNVKEQCWRKAPLVTGRDPSRWRLDAVGNPVMYALRGCEGVACHEYDHIAPWSRGGRSELSNCQILQTRANRMKGNEDDDPQKLKGYSCKRQFTEREMDVIEQAVYGSVKRDGLKCRCWSVLEDFEEMAGNLPILFGKEKLPDCT